ncbi:AAA family ATPase [Naumannella sp. ID2617S]|nr:AAA family ATPase [Naumannella sp. ID2617S]
MDTQIDLIVLAGIPGAGKTTALQGVGGTEAVRVLDPEPHRDRLARVLPGVRYRHCRWLVHTLHHLQVLFATLRGPVRGRTLLVHDPGTRRWSRRLLARLAQVRGWRAGLVVVDVPRAEAIAGQVARGRVVRPASFDGHWHRWAELRDAPESLRAEGWRLVLFTSRGQAQPLLHALVADQSAYSTRTGAWSETLAS